MSLLGWSMLVSQYWEMVAAHERLPVKLWRGLQLDYMFACAFLCVSAAPGLTMGGAWHLGTAQASDLPLPAGHSFDVRGGKPVTLVVLVAMVVVAVVVMVWGVPWQLLTDSRRDPRSLQNGCRVTFYSQATMVCVLRLSASATRSDSALLLVGRIPLRQGTFQACRCLQVGLLGVQWLGYLLRE